MSLSDIFHPPEWDMTESGLSSGQWIDRLLAIIWANWQPMRMAGSPEMLWFTCISSAKPRQVWFVFCSWGYSTYCHTIKVVQWCLLYKVPLYELTFGFLGRVLTQSFWSMFCILELGYTTCGLGQLKNIMCLNRLCWSKAMRGKWN